MSLLPLEVYILCPPYAPWRSLIVQNSHPSYDETKLWHDIDERIKWKMEDEGNLSHKLYYNDGQFQSPSHCDPSHDTKYDKNIAWQSQPVSWLIDIRFMDKWGALETKETEKALDERCPIEEVGISVPSVVQTRWISKDGLNWWRWVLSRVVWREAPESTIKEDRNYLEFARWDYLNCRNIANSCRSAADSEARGGGVREAWTEWAWGKWGRGRRAGESEEAPWGVIRGCPRCFFRESRSRCPSIP